MHINIARSQSLPDGLSGNVETVKVAGRTIDLGRFNAVIVNEYAERAPTKDVPQGYAPSAQFNNVASEIEQYRSTMATELGKKPNSDITHQDILAMRALEILSTSAQRGPESRITKSVIAGNGSNQASIGLINRMSSNQKNHRGDTVMATFGIP